MPKRKSKSNTWTQTKKRKKTKSQKHVVPTEVPFALGFKPPAKRHCEQAIGKPPLPPEFQATDAFKPLPQPIYDLDWLAQRIEYGQTFDQFIGTSYWYSKRNILKNAACRHNPNARNIPEKYSDGKIYLLPLGQSTDQSNKAFDIDDLAEYTNLFYGLPVRVLDRVPTVLRRGELIALKRKIAGVDEYDEVRLTTRYDEATEHHQVRIDSGLCELKDLVPSDALFVVIVTLVDLYCDKSDLFVAGIGNVQANMAIFSFFRYHPALTFSEEHWFDYEITPCVTGESECSNLQLQRSCKLLVHEIGHILGIGHCIYYSCVMNGSGNLQEDIRQPHHLCPVDLRKVSALCGVDVLNRYEGLARFYAKHGMEEENTWVKSRIQYLKNTAI